MAKAEPHIVIALESFDGGLGEERLHFSKGDLMDSDHPAVKKWKNMFGPLTVRYPLPAPKVEQATAAPGEKRGA
jgi:hypothetical protein